MAGRQGSIKELKGLAETERYEAPSGSTEQRARPVAEGGAEGELHSPLCFQTAPSTAARRPGCRSLGAARPLEEKWRARSDSWHGVLAPHLSGNQKVGAKGNSGGIGGLLLSGSHNVN